MKGSILFTQSQKTGLTILAGFLLAGVAAIFVWNWVSTEEYLAGPPEDPAQLFEMPALPGTPTLRLDINLADSADWVQLPGIGTVLAPRIVKFRQAIGGFHSIEDLERVYNLSPAVLAAIRPQLYVDSLTIPSKRPQRSVHVPATGYQGPPIDVNTATAEELARLPGIGAVLSQRIVSFREKKRGYNSVDEVGRVYQLSEEVFLEIRPHLTMTPFPGGEETSEREVLSSSQPEERTLSQTYRGLPPNVPAPRSVNLNLADSAELVLVPGIGPVLSKRILKYRKLLGFYASVDLLRHVYGMSEENFERMQPFLNVGEPDSFPKRDLNSAYRNGLAFYPFVGQQLAEGLINYRRDLGRFDTWEEVSQVPGMTEDALAGLQQYFHL